MKKSPLLIFLAFAFAYFMSFGLRTINAVLAPELVQEFALSNAELGALSSAYFFSFALMQLPLGVLLDRYGPRLTNSVLLSVAALGCLLFSVAKGFLALYLARALIGIGVSGALMASLSAYRFSFGPERQQQLAAWMLMAGSFGALATTLPVRWALPVTGWRPMFWFAAALLVLAALAILAWVPERHRVAARPAASDGTGVAAVASPGAAGVALPAVGSLKAYRFVMSEAHFWRFGLLSVFIQGSFISFQSLWAGPWLVQVSGLSPDESATTLMLLNLVLMCGFLGIGLVAPRISPQRIAPLLALTSFLVMATQLALVMVPGEAGSLTKWMGAILWLTMALVSVPVTLLQPHACLSFAHNLTGRAYAAYNLLIFIGVFLAQWMFGVIADVFKGGGQNASEAIRWAMVVWVAVEFVAVLCFLFWPFRREADESLAERQPA